MNTTEWRTRALEIGWPEHMIERFARSARSMRCVDIRVHEHVLVCWVRSTGSRLSLVRSDSFSGIARANRALADMPGHREPREMAEWKANEYPKAVGT
jgi:hypothetical protein